MSREKLGGAVAVVGAGRRKRRVDRALRRRLHVHVQRERRDGQRVQLRRGHRRGRLQHVRHALPIGRTLPPAAINRQFGRTLACQRRRTGTNE